MSVSPAQALRGAAVAGLAIAWAIAAHIGSTGEGSPDFNTALGVAPLVAAAAMLIGRSRHLPLVVAGTLSLLGTLALLWTTLRQNVAALYLVQHVGINLALASLFGRTLRGPGEALVTRLARLVYPQGISPRKIRYTRGVTLAWTLFFVTNATLSALLYVFAPAAVWSVYANLLDLPLLATMFLGEHLWRMRVLPPEERPGVAEIIRAWHHHHGSPRA